MHWWGRHIYSCFSFLAALSVAGESEHSSRCWVWEASGCSLSTSQLFVHIVRFKTVLGRGGLWVGQAGGQAFPWSILFPLSQIELYLTVLPLAAVGWDHLCLRKRLQSCHGKGAYIKLLLFVKCLKSGCLGSSPSSSSYEPSNLTAVNPSFFIWKVGIIISKTYITFTIF